MRRTSELAACAAVLLACSTTASAAITFHATEVAFDAAVATGFRFLGTEDFEQSEATGFGAFNDSLEPGLLNGPFPMGTNAAIGLTVQSNTDGTSAFGDGASVPGVAPSGQNGLATAGAFPTHQVSGNFGEHSLDLLFDLPGMNPVTAVKLAPLFFDLVTFGVDVTGSIIVEVYDASNVFAGEVQVDNVDFGVNTDLEFIGIVASGGMNIGRINLSDTNNATLGDSGAGVAGVDNISVYTVPEAGSGALAGLVLALLAVGRQRRRGTG